MNTSLLLSESTPTWGKIEVGIENKAKINCQKKGYEPSNSAATRQSSMRQYEGKEYFQGGKLELLMWKTTLEGATGFKLRCQWNSHSFLF